MREPMGNTGEANVSADVETQVKPEKQYIPDGYDSVEDFLKEALKLYRDDYDDDEHNIIEAMEDLKFIYVDQWDEETRAQRESQGRPCITVNTLPQYIGQVVGDRRLNRTAVKVLPKQGGSIEEAKVRAGLIKGIEMHSRADRVFDRACEDQVGCGISNVQVTLEYAVNDVFRQDLFVRDMDNPLAVVWDRFSRDPTGRDARRCFVEESMSQEEYEELWPDKPIPAGGSQMLESRFTDWFEQNVVKIVAYWRMIEKPATFAMFEDGSVRDVTDLDPAEYMDRVAVDPVTNEPIVGEGTRSYAQRHLITAFDILEGPYELPLSRLPIIRVSGRIGRVGTRQYRFGLTRWARDPSMLRNYWRSIAAEHLAMAPKAQWLADSNSVKGREEDFRNAHLTGDPLLVYNAGKNAPTRIDPPQLQGAVLNEANVNAQDIKDVTGLHDASLGIRSNEVSGKAIMARQREGDVATITYHDHLNHAIEEVGSVLNELLPLTYDTMRTVLVVGDDDREEQIVINDPNDPAGPNITTNRYDVMLTTGPSFTTQRMEAAEYMLEAMKVNPEIFSIAGDLIVKAQDWPDGPAIAERLAKVIPGAQEEKEPEIDPATGQPVMTPEMEAQAAAMQQAQAMEQMQAEMMQAEMQAKLQALQYENQKLEQEALEAKARAEKAVFEARIAESNSVKAEAEAELKAREVKLFGINSQIELSQKMTPSQSSETNSSSGGAPRRAARSRKPKR